MEKEMKRNLGVRYKTIRKRKAGYLRGKRR